MMMVCFMIVMNVRDLSIYHLSIWIPNYINLLTIFHLANAISNHTGKNKHDCKFCAKWVIMLLGFQRKTSRNTWLLMLLHYWTTKFHVCMLSVCSMLCLLVIFTFVYLISGLDHIIHSRSFTHLLFLSLNCKSC